MTAYSAARTMQPSSRDRTLGGLIVVAGVLFKACGFTGHFTTIRGLIRVRQLNTHSANGWVAKLPLTRDSLQWGARSVWLMVLVLVSGLSSVMAVGRDKAVLVGSTSPTFLDHAIRQAVDGRPPIEGTIDITSDAALAFDAGSRWSAKLPYAAITQLTYGVEASRQARGIRIAFPWPGSSQFTDKPHYILTVVRRQQSGAEDSDVFELGRDLVRPVIETLERRTGIRVEFLSVDACLTLKTAKDCRLGSPDELRGLKRVHVDARNNAKHRADIVAEIENANVGLQVVAGAEDAEILLRFHGERFFEDKTIDGGRGEVTVVRNSDSVVVLQFTDRDTSVWGRAPSINFSREFVKAYKKANIQ